MAWKTFMVGTDFSEQSTTCLKLAALYAKKFNGKLQVVHISNNFEEHALPIMMDTVIADGKTYKQFINENLNEILKVQLSKAQIDLPTSQIETIIELGNPKNTFLEIIEEKKPDVLFLGYHGHNVLSELVMGSVTEKMLKVSPTSLLIQKEEQTKLPSDVFAFVDFSDYTTKLLDKLVELNLLSPIKVSFGHLVEADPEMYLSLGENEGLADINTIQQLLDREKAVGQEKMEQLVTEATKRGLVACGEVVVGKDFQTAQNLLGMTGVDKADLILLSPHSKSFLEKFLFGSTAQKVVELSKKNLLVVK